MRAVLPLFFFVLGTMMVFAQPANDNCSGAINLNLSATCTTNVFTNIGATTSNIGNNNSPACFNGGTTQRDVWFSFTTPANIRQVTIRVNGVNTGPNADALLNPQIALYRGTCTGLSLLECISAPLNSGEVQLNALNLTPNVTYFIRVNEYSATATPNSGDFNICVQPFVPAVNLGDASGSSSCTGTLYDSGGPNGDYRILEDFSFTICPTEPHSCIDLNLEEFDIEPTILGFFGDVLTFHAGETVNAPLLARVEGQDIGTNFRIQASTRCVTVRFQSDFLANFAGFKLTWECSAAPCDNKSFDNPTPITTLPFSQTGISTCESASTIANSPCAADDYLYGPEYVFAYDAPGNTCISVDVTGAANGTGVVILDGLPGDSTTNCIGRSTSGKITSANLLVAGTYYIVVANGSGCTPFSINVEETTCAISPALVNALCNPLNGCVRLDGLPTVFDFEDGFQDMQISIGSNNGCWLGFGVEPNFYWFTVQAQADGRFGFILDSANPDTLSDLDFNVWGPFSQDEVCTNPQNVITFIRNNQPIRSSWSPTSGPTGLTDTHPEEDYRITDAYDCGAGPADAGADGDDFVRTIPAKKGDVYVVLINDWENLIGDEGVAIDWSPSDPPVLEQLPTEVVAGDTAVCRGNSVQIQLESPVNSITWLNDTETLSCNNCPNPIATPLQTTEYRAVVNAVCYDDTISVRVQVYDVDAGPDLTVCRGAIFELIAGEDFENGVYSWQVPAAVELSCTDCSNPTITTPTAGTFPVIVTLTAPGCTARDTVNITVRAETAPTFSISEDVAICEGTTVNLGGASTTVVNYSWTSNPGGFTSTEANPQVMPMRTTTYILQATNAVCPLATLDSVQVTVFSKPILNVAADTAVCQEQPVLLGNTTEENGVDYLWSGPQTIVETSDPNTLAFPLQSGLYILSATTGGGICETRDTVNIEVTPIEIEIQLEDTVQICRGEPLVIPFNVVPADAPVIFASTNGLFRDTISADSITLMPDRLTTYIAQVNSQGCSRFDTLTVVVDSLPSNLAIMPGDTSVCQGSLILLTSEIYEPSDFPNIEFKWEPSNGQQTPDSLYNMVISADTTTLYYRITTSGVCVDSAFANVEVKPIPQIMIIPSDTSVCAGQPVRLTATSMPADVEKPMWEPATGVLTCVECFDPIATVITSSSFTFTAEKDGCPGSASASINILPPPVVQLNPNNVICQGESIQLNFAFTPGAEYRWTSSTNPNFSSNDPRLVVSPTQTTTYRLQSSNGGCPGPNSEITVIVVQPATVTINGDSTICRGETLSLTAVGNAPAGVQQSYRWEVNGQLRNGPNLSVNGLIQDTQIRLIYTYGNNCGQVVRTLNVDIQEGPSLVEISVAPGDTIFEGQTVTLTAITEPPSLAGATYAWTANGQPLSGNGAQIQDNPIQTTDYNVVVTLPNGCSTTSAEQEVIVLEVNVQIPNAFTPNGDGRNDFFNIVTEAPVEIVEFKVFNRWGQLVYNNENPTQGWNGRVNGRDAPSDVYAYYIIVRTPGGEVFPTFRGDVTLIR